MRSGICLLVCILTIGYHVANGQSVNLVPNPSFELKNACPTGTSANNTVIIPDPTYTQFPTVQAWIRPTLSEADYFNSCYTPGSGNPANLTGSLYPVGVPSNWYGTMNAHTGNAYVGCWAQEFYPRVNYRSYVETKLDQKMIAGHKYYVSFYTAPASMLTRGWTYYHIIAVDMIGAAFSNTVVYSPSTAGNAQLIPNAPDIVSPKGQFFTDTSKWTKVEGIYTAKGGEQWMVLGHFADAPVSNVLVRNPLTTNQNSNDSMCYMYYDDVSVIDMSSSDVHVHDTGICATAFPLTLAPADTGTQYFWNTGAIAASINVSDSGTYWRGALGEMTYYTDTFRVHVIPSPTLDLGRDSSYCPGSTVLLLANHAYPHYLWSTGDTTIFLIARGAGQYTLQVTDACRIQKDSINVFFVGTQRPIANDTAICLHVPAPILNVTGDSLRWYSNLEATTGTNTQPVINTDMLTTTTLFVTQSNVCGESDRQAIDITIVSPPAVIVNKDTDFCSGAIIQLTAVSKDGYRWSTGETNCCINIGETGRYIVTVDNVCGTVNDSIDVVFKDCQQCLWVPSAFTPNADGKNDRFNMVHPCSINAFHIVIVNRWGQKVFEGNNIDDSWTGTFNGAPVESGTYFYSIEYMANIPGAKMTTRDGDVTVLR